MTIQFELTSDPGTWIDVFGVVPDKTAGQSIREIEMSPVVVGNRACRLADWFRVTGQPGSDHHLWQGDLGRVNGIGHAMRSGWIQVEGNAGHHAGSQMSGGTLQIKGDVGDYLGAELASGLIQIEGDAGDCVGSAYSGQSHGQNGGAILVRGNAGNSTGHTIRRGMLAVLGDVGNCCGYQMRAGTIVVGGRTKKNLGLEMIRGTIWLGKRPSETPRGFAAAGSGQPTIVRIIDRYLCQLGFPSPMQHEDCELFHGDMLCGGRGELFIATKA